MKISISGIRGIYGDDLSLHDVVKFSRLFGTFIGKFGTKACFLTRDTRPSSDILLKTVCAGLMAQGIDVYKACAIRPAQTVLSNISLDGRVIYCLRQFVQ